MKNIKALTLFVILLFCAAAMAQDSASMHASPALPQSKDITAAVERETSPEKKKELCEVIDAIDRIYGSIRSGDSGKKIVIYVDPAHGMVNVNGKMEWQGAVTWRKSTTGVPEELYSIPICRDLYRLLSSNPNIEVVSTPDFIEVMKGNAEVYKDVTFDETVEWAKKQDAFLILSEHLNNISPIWKADGFVNLEGCHITCDSWRTPMISYINGVYKGYYTYYSVYDVTGSSKTIADRFRDNMIAKGHQPNGWDNGAVADDRFASYIGYPISFIFESGFISNPAEESALKTPEFRRDVVMSQYRAILDTIKAEFGVDISGHVRSIDKSDVKRYEDNIEAIKLSRVFVWCTQKGEFTNALAALATLEKQNASGAHKWSAWAYSEMRRRLQRIASGFDTGAWREKKGSLSKAASNYLDVIRTMGYHPLFNGVRETAYERYNAIARRIGLRKQTYNYSIAYQESFPPELQALRSNIENHSLTTPYIVPIQQGETLDEAIDLAIAPSTELREKIVQAVKNSRTTQTVWDKSWSKKKKKYVYYKRYVKVKPDFSPGIYLMTFGRNYQVTWVSKANNIPLNPKAYQNQQFLKNSCFAEKSKERSL